MTKKWQELEFLDYKQRQIRRRAQKKKSLLDEAGLLPGSSSGGDSQLQVKILLVGTSLTLLLLLYVVYIRSLSPGAAAGSLAVVRSTGAVTISTPLRDWPVEPGEELSPGVRVITRGTGKAELVAHVSDTRILVFEDTEFEFSTMRLGQSSEEFQLSCRVHRGSVVFEFQNPRGIGIVHIRTPQDVELWGKLVHLKVEAGDDRSRIIVADGTVKAEAGGDVQIIQADRQMTSTFSSPVSPCQSINIIREIWSW